MAIVMVVIGFAQSFSDMGVSNAIIHKQEVTGNQLSSLFWLNILSGLIVFLILVVISPVISFFYNEPDLTELILLSAISFVILPFGQQFRILLQKELHFSALSKIDILSAIIGFMTTVISVVNSYGIYSIIFGLLARTSSMSLLLLFIGLKFHKPGFIFSKEELNGFISFGLYQMGEKSLNFFSSNMDKIIIGRLFGMEILGFYNLAYQLMIYPMKIISPVINTVSFPIYSRIQTDMNKLNSLYIHNIEIITFICFPVYFGLYSISDQVVNTFYGPGWDQTIILFNIIWVLGVTKSISNSIGPYLLSLGKAKTGFYLNLLVLCLCSSLLLTGSFVSIDTMLWIFVIGNIIVLFPMDYYIRYKITKMSMVKHIKSYQTNLILSAIMCFCVLQFKKIIPFPTDESIVINISFGILLYATLSFIFNKSIIRKHFLKHQQKKA